MKNTLLSFLIVLLFSPIYSQNWQEVTSSPDRVSGFQLIGEQTVLATAYGDSAIHKTNNGGSTWSNIPVTYSPSTTTPSVISSFHFIDASNGWLASRSSSYHQYLFKTSDGGDSWTQIYYNTGASLNKIYFKDALNGWALNGWMKEIWETHDGGLSWNVAFTSTPNGSFPNDIFFLDNNNGFIVGYRSIFRTINGGLNWTEHFLGEKMNNIHFNTTLEGYACAYEYGNFYKTIDGGSNWTLHYQDTTLPEMTSIHFTSPQIGYWSGGSECRFGACHGEPRILKTTDGGNSWTAMIQPLGWLQAPNKQYHDVKFTTGGIGWMNSSDGKMAKLESITNVSNLKEKTFTVTTYPNPCSDILFIEQLHTQPISIKVSNQLGIVLVHQNVSNQINTINIDDLPTGIYTLTIQNKKQLLSQQILKIN
jgi:photosystem II stability/assembly factor-like uncharacterized protein